MDKASELLTAARALIEDEANWCQGDWTRIKEDGAVRRCTTSALDRAVSLSGASVGTQNQAVGRLGMAAGELSGLGGPFDIAWFNDTGDHAEVMAMFDLAIEQASA